MITIKTLNENLYQINDTKLELPCSIYKALKITVDIANYEIEQLQDKLTQRNKQVADLKHRLEEKEDTLKELKEIINAFDLDGVNDQEHLEALKIIVNK